MPHVGLHRSQQIYYVSIQCYFAFFSPLVGTMMMYIKKHLALYVAIVTSFEPLTEVKFQLFLSERVQSLELILFGQFIMSPCLNRETDHMPQNYVNYLVLRLANEAAILAAYRQNDAFPHMRSVKTSSL